MTELTAESVKTWRYEKGPGGVKMPVMTTEEREAWRELSNRKATEHLSREEFLLWAALDRKVQYRAKQESKGRDIEWHRPEAQRKRALDRKRGRYGR